VRRRRGTFTSASIAAAASSASSSSSSSFPYIVGRCHLVFGILAGRTSQRDRKRETRRILAKPFSQRSLSLSLLSFFGFLSLSRSPSLLLSPTVLLSFPSIPSRSSLSFLKQPFICNSDGFEREGRERERKGGKERWKQNRLERVFQRTANPLPPLRSSSLFLSPSPPKGSQGLNFSFLAAERTSCVYFFTVLCSPAFSFHFAVTPAFSVQHVFPLLK
jgi:hypothetical protein